MNNKNNKKNFREPLPMTNRKKKYIGNKIIFTNVQQPNTKKSYIKKPLINPEEKQPFIQIPESVETKNISSSENNINTENITKTDPQITESVETKNISSSENNINTESEKNTKTDPQNINSQLEQNTKSQNKPTNILDNIFLKYQKENDD